MSATTLDEQRVDQAVTIERIAAAAYKIPTDAPESDGTLQWDSTTLVAIHIAAGGCEGFGYTYAPAAAARLIDEKLADVVRECNAFEVEACWHAMVHAVRNAGHPGVAFAAISAIDTALWDLKGQAAEFASLPTLGRGPRRSAAIWQWWFHVLRRGPAPRATRWLG